MGEPIRLPLTKVVIDESLYPRYRESAGTISQYAEAKRAGAQFPPIKLDQNYRLIDGLHRYRADELNGAEFVEYELERVKNDLDFFKRAMTANAHHGHRYTSIDYAHMVLRGEELGLNSNEIAELVYVTPGFLEEATRDWFALNGKKEKVALKRTIRHMAGRKLTNDQLDANRKISGMNQTFYINQLALLLDNDLFDTENPVGLIKLAELQVLVGNYLLKHSEKLRDARRAAANGN